MALQITSTRSAKVWKLGGVFFAVLALFVQPLVALNIPAAFAATTVVVRKADMQGWTKYGGAPSEFVAEPSILGKGALKLSANTATDYSMHWKNVADKSTLAKNVNVHYSSKRISGPDHAAPAYTYW